MLVCFLEGDQLLVVAENGRGIFFFGLYIDGGIAGIQLHPGVAVVEAAILSGSPLYRCTGVVTTAVKNRAEGLLQFQAGVQSDLVSWPRVLMSSISSMEWKVQFFMPISWP